MSGALSHLGGDRWKVRVYAGLDPSTGKQRQRSRTFRASSKRAAERAAPGHVAELLASIDDEAERRGTVGELVDEWLAHQEATGASPSTLGRVRSICARIDHDLGDVRLDELNARHVDAWYATLRTTPLPRRSNRPDEPDRYLSESTVHHYHRVLGAMLRQGERWDMIDRSPMHRVTAPRNTRAEIAPPTDELLERLLADLDEPTLLPVLVSAQCGLRRGELFGLRWCDVSADEIAVRVNTLELPDGTLHDKAPKGRRARTVPITPNLAHVLDGHRARCEVAAGHLGADLADDARLFPDFAADPTGRVPLRPGWLSQRWRRHCDRHDVRVRLHDLRHWCATRLLADGVPVHAVRDMLGHADASTTLDIYGHAVDEGRDQVRRAMQSAPRGGAGELGRGGS